eukprot:3179434-Amphidinium_carterae.1
MCETKASQQEATRVDNHGECARSANRAMGKFVKEDFRTLGSDTESLISPVCQIAAAVPHKVKIKVYKSCAWRQ